ncbi:lactonase family protein [Rhizobium sp. TH2]|uniref:lactonase family protein n=1 Tax=Rhizobium sp. TH2 TaxID=2775403 RepID=UPI0021589D0C|nr:lactonase family protein [Rhizobium sp. TH2]UVC09329.1 lactonase family protein [Rhizobium sp. TH2]
MRFATASAKGRDRHGRAVKPAATLFSSDESAAPQPVFVSHAAPDPSYLAVSSLHKVLYVASENSAEGRISALRLDADGLTLLGSVGTGGHAAVHLAIDQTGRWLAVANYRGEPKGQDLSVAVFPIQVDGMLGDLAASARQDGSGPDRDRQATPHTHCVAFSPDNRLLAAVDLGTDGLWLYHFNAASGALGFASQIKLPAGSGPRHCAFHPREPLIYVCTELDSTLVTLRYDPAAGTADIVDSDAATKVPGKGAVNRLGTKNANYPSGLVIAPDGRYLMMGNRGPDTVAIFWIDPETGTARYREEVPCGGKFPRAIRLDSTGRVLAVANNKSGNVTLFSRDFESGKLTAMPHGDFELPTAMDVIFLD